MPRSCAGTEAFCGLARGAVPWSFVAARAAVRTLRGAAQEAVDVGQSGRTLGKPSKGEAWNEGWFKW